MDILSRCWLNLLSFRNNSQGYPLMLIALAIASGLSYPRRVESGLMVRDPTRFCVSIELSDNSFALEISVTLSVFQLENDRSTRLEADGVEHLASSVWVDPVEPDDDKRSRVQTESGQNLATHPELEDIEASARSSEDEDGLHVHSFFFLEDAEDHAGNSTVAFTIRESRLFALRECELPAFRLYHMRVCNQMLVDGNAYELLLDLFEIKIEQLAGEIKNICNDPEKLNRVIMEDHQGGEYDETLSALVELEDIGWRVRLCLMDVQRAPNFLVCKARLPVGQLEQTREVLRGIGSLLPYNESLFQKVDFLVQVTMGLVNIGQNRIIRIFSMVSMVLLPSILMTSSYGMNFEPIPELRWSLGYSGAIAFMMLTGLAPYLYFKRKNWLQERGAVAPFFTGQGRLSLYAAGAGYTTYRR